MSHEIRTPLNGVLGMAQAMAMGEVTDQQRERLNAVLAERTGQSIEQIGRDTDRDHFMSAEAAAAYGLIDRVLTSRGEAFEPDR